MTQPTAPTLTTYWQQGAKLIEACAAKADRCSKDAREAFLDAPIGLTPEQAVLWHSAQAEAYRHALEMMAPPSDDTTEELLLRTVASTKTPDVAVARIAA